MRPGHQFDHVSLLIHEGFGDARIGALTGIPRSTVRDWRRKGRPGERQTRYFFTNRSGDILEIFRRACEEVGISCRKSRPDTISIAKREDVAILDSFIGQKT
jgi:hypothetical protein